MSGPPLAAERARMHPYWLERNLCRGTTRRVVEECEVLTVQDALDGERTDAVLVSVPQRIGTTEKGVRRWLVCPDCDSRRSWLLLLDDGGLSCRVCCGVPYRSQHLSRVTLLRYRAYGLVERLAGVDASGVLRKPLRMHWAKYTRLRERIRALERAAGALEGGITGGILGRAEL